MREIQDNENRMIAVERREKIRQFLQNKQFVSSSELCRLLGSSESTIRRDLELMEENGLIERVHGGAVLTKHIIKENEYSLSDTTNLDEKTRIAECACSMIEANDVVFLNHGTTTALIASALAKRHSLESITVISSNFEVINALVNTDVQLICLGGNFRNTSHSLIGSLTAENINNFNANKFFIGLGGINVRYGCTFEAEQDALVSKLMASKTHGQIIAVADHEKWGSVCKYNCIGINSISSLITGRELSDEIEPVFSEIGVNLFRV